MKQILTLFLVAMLMLANNATVYGQAGEPFPDDFIFFVDGINTEIPSYDTRISVVDDPTDPTNKVLQYNWADGFPFYPFHFSSDAAVGADLTKNRMDGDVLNARIWVHPDNAGKGRVHLMFEDKTDGSGEMDGSADLPFRLVWNIPDSLRNGQWHDISAPLPPPTYKELEDAKKSGDIDGLDSLWIYAGAWSSGGFGVGIDDRMGPNTTHNPDLWEEFEWTNVQNIGVHFDNNQGGGVIYLDDVYIGAPNLDLSDQNAPASPAMGVTAVASADSNTISWASITDAGGYKVYYSLEEFMDVSDPGVALVATLGKDATSIGHKIEVPHASLAPLTLYYAVTTISNAGVENDDISMSKSTVENENLPVQPYIAELTGDQETHLEDLLFDDSFEDVANGFPEGYKPFELNTKHFKQGDAGLPDGDDDLSGRLWAGYGADPPLLYLYVEVTDDQISLQAAGENPANGWQHDSIEFGWGNYDVRDVEGGGVFTGSPHQDILRGEFADYQFRVMGQGDGTKGGTDAVAFTGWSIDAVPQGSESIYDQLLDGNQVLGYKILSVIPLDQIQLTDSNDAQIEYPTGDEIGYFPFNFVLNDGDGGNRDAQIQWSIKGNADGQWWNTPAQWPAVALVGKDVGAPETPAGLQLSATADGTAITSLDVAEGATQTYYLKLLTQPTSDVSITISGQAGTSLVLDNDGDASTDFTGMTFTSENWNTAQMVMVTSMVDGDGDDETVMLTHSSKSDDSDYDEMTYLITVNVSDVTQTNTEDGIELPDEVTLYHNYPNPFNPSTVITFALPASETVSLRIFDSVGRTVSTLLDQQLQSAGVHSVQFDASGLASGVYLYTLESESSVLLTRRMLLVK
ncbi:MAG: T9SS type A sorting domain-containing protein [Bacteroidetes bacterium]|nr:T9SS type A sorting domain-containing protein [Bacteroidota bacterium]